MKGKENSIFLSQVRRIPRMVLMFLLPIAIMVFFNFSSFHIITRFSPLVNQQSFCLFLSLVIFSALMGIDLQNEFYKRLFVLSLLFQAIFINHMAAPYAIECLYMAWLILREDKPSTYLIFFNIVLSLSLMALVLFEPLPAYLNALLGKIILVAASLRCMFVNFKFAKKSTMSTFEDVVFSTFSLFLISSLIPMSNFTALLSLLIVCVAVMMVSRFQYKFFSMCVWQFFIVVSSGLLQGLALPLFLVSFYPMRAVDKDQGNVKFLNIILYAVILMALLVKSFLHDAFALDLTGVLALQWIIGNVIFGRIFEARNLKVIMLVFIIYLFY